MPDSDSSSPAGVVTREQFDSKLKLLRKKRDFFQSTIAVAHNLAVELQKLGSDALTSPQVSIFRARCGKLKEVYHSFQAAQNKILEFCYNSNLPDSYIPDSERASEVEEIYYFVLSVYEYVTALSSSVQSSVVEESNVQLASSQKCRLPAIDIPHFSGSFAEWQSFRDLFLSVVHNRDDISHVEKFSYLKTSLKGNALAIIKSVPFGEVHYTTAWKELCDHYDNPRLLGFNYLDKLLEFPSSSGDSLSSLTKFVSTFSEIHAALKTLNIPDLGEFILFRLAARVIEKETMSRFEHTLSGEIFPTVTQLVGFVKKQIKVLQSVSGNVSPTGSSRLPKPPVKVSFSTCNESTKNQSKQGFECPMCFSLHPLYKCSKYLNMEVEQRNNFARSKSLCLNCLKFGHMASKCRLKDYCCKICRRYHHTSLHTQDNGTSGGKKGTFNSFSETTHLPAGREGVASTHSFSPPHEPPEPLSLGNVSTFAAETGGYHNKTVLLGTAVVNIRDGKGRPRPIRLMIDSGSMISAISNEAVKRLRLPVSQFHGSLFGLSRTPLRRPRGCVSCSLTPTHTSFPIISTQAVVLPCLTRSIPSVSLPLAVREKVSHLKLADPAFDEPALVDFLLGADVFPGLLRGGRRTFHNGKLVALESIFGWILMGAVEHIPPHESPPIIACHTFADSPLENQLKKFWEIEEMPSVVFKNPDDLLCEQHFLQTHRRDETGRYIVSLPFKRFPPCLGESYSQAATRWVNLERKLRSKLQWKHDYIDFMKEYEQLGHMSPASDSGDYFIPHHAIFKPILSGSKIRVVFDASARTSSGQSLNDELFTGPKLQKEIFDILLTFRLHMIAFTTDITKMYRQILVTPQHRRYQHILWRDDSCKALRPYELNTVTYGVVSSPFLAIRVLHQLAKDESHNFPRAAEVLVRDTYVDDIVTGAHSISAALDLQKQLINLLSSGGFPLGKWASNSEELLSSFPKEQCESFLHFDTLDYSALKVLGLFWAPNPDTFSFSVAFDQTVNSKRKLFSNIARIFDPIGFLAPVVFWAKHLMQSTWHLKLGWDDSLPPEIECDWNTFVSQAPLLSQIRIPRCICPSSSMEYQLIGFCDASERGYSAIVYLRILSHSGEIQTQFLAAKTKLAPLKSLSIPKLELLGALLLSRLVDRVLNTFRDRLTFLKIYTWSDSQVVLSWLRLPLHSLKVFVANRVMEILKSIPLSSWGHIKSEMNPADCASRGLLPQQLLSADLYWQGPAFLRKPESEWPSRDIGSTHVSQLPELKAANFTVAIAQVQEHSLTWMNKFSSYVRLIRTTAYVLRFLSSFKGVRFPPHTPLSNSEWSSALIRLVKIIQHFHFHQYLDSIRGETRLPISLARLRPFLDENGLIRVGGRLQHSTLQPLARQPWLLPKNDHFSTLIVQHYHWATLHGGPRAVESLISRQFWILSVRKVIRSQLAKCVTCARFRGIPLQPIMASLPKSRITRQNPFICVGVDYAGPFMLKASHRRNASLTKAYLCLFVCFCTKAVHLELVTSLSTVSFIAAFQRFISRRGIPSKIYSDCGTNFVGADRLLSELYKFIRSQPHKQDLASSFSASGIEWVFNPPSAPHFGGLWEAGIKSVKYHLRRVLHGQPLNFEEYSTLLCKIEAILNSRPLTSLSSDPSEVDCLTPGHFLIGQPLLALPGVSSEESLSLPTRWRLLEQISKQFWKRWSHEYLHTLQQLAKWTRHTPKPKIGELFLIRDPIAPPSCWKMGRIIRVFPDAAGVVRIVELRTRSGNIIRPVVKLVPLPASQ